MGHEDEALRDRLIRESERIVAEMRKLRDTSLRSAKYCGDLALQAKDPTKRDVLPPDAVSVVEGQLELFDVFAASNQKGVKQLDGLIQEHLERIDQLRRESA